MPAGGAGGMLVEVQGQRIDVDEIHPVDQAARLPIQHHLVCRRADGDETQDGGPAIVFAHRSFRGEPELAALDGGGLRAG